MTHHAALPGSTESCFVSTALSFLHILAVHEIKRVFKRIFVFKHNNLKVSDHFLELFLRRSYSNYRGVLKFRAQFLIQPFEKWVGI